MAARDFFAELPEKAEPVLGLLTGATVWGLIWYPYRVLELAGASEGRDRAREVYRRPARHVRRDDGRNRHLAGRRSERP